MNNLSRALAAALMAATIPATIVLAQQPAPGDQPGVEKSERPPRPLARDHGSPAGRPHRHGEGSTQAPPEQETLWTPVEANIRASFEERRSKHEAREAKREERRAERAARATTTRSGSSWRCPSASKSAASG